jgi:hypothetical protein
MDYLKERWMREIEDVIDDPFLPVDHGSSAAADTEDEKTTQHSVDSADYSVFTPSIEDFTSLELEENSAVALLERGLEYETKSITAEEALLQQFMTATDMPEGGAEAIDFPLAPDFLVGTSLR